MEIEGKSQQIVWERPQKKILIDEGSPYWEAQERHG